MNSGLLYNLLSLLLVILTFSIKISGQVGTRLAVNLSTLSISEEILQKADREAIPKIGFDVGIFYDIHITNRIVCQPSLNLVKLSSKIDLKDGYYSYRSFYNFQIPINIKYLCFSIKRHSIYFFAAPYIGVGVGRPNFKFCTPGDQCEEFSLSYSGTQPSDYDLINYGYQFGASYHLNTKLSFDIKKQNSLTSIFNDRVKDGGVYRHRTVSLGMSYSFN